jgi:hypothetical protein
MPQPPRLHDRLKPLAQAPMSVIPAAVQSATEMACSGARPKATAIRAAPKVCPISRPDD